MASPAAGGVRGPGVAPADHVVILNIQDRRASRRPKPFIVRWKVNGRQFGKAFSSIRLAESWRRRELIAAHERGWPFSCQDGMPVEPAREKPQQVTFYEFAVRHLRRKWDQWQAKSRKSAVEALIIACTDLLDEHLPPDLLRPARTYLTYVALLPKPAREATGQEERARAWLEAHSLPLVSITPVRAEELLDTLATRLDGRPTAATTKSRRRNVVHHLFKMAAREGLVPANPIDNVDARVVKRPRAIDKATIPTFDQAKELIELASALGGQRNYAWLSCILYAGMRPEEVSQLHLSEMTLPSDGSYGEARVHGGTVNAGKRYSNSGTAYDRQGQKWRHVDAAPRQVPLPPELVSIIRDHIASYGVGQDGLLFRNKAGNPLTVELTGKAFRKARAKLHPPMFDAQGNPLPAWQQADKLCGVTPYDLRHTYATIPIRQSQSSNGMPSKALIAKWLGHSERVLEDIYSGVFDNDQRLALSAMAGLFA